MKLLHNLNSNDNLTLQIKKKGISTFDSLTHYIKQLPYGRNKNRNDFTLVWKEQKGTCSSKHAFLKYIANLNNIPNIELILGMYKMSNVNTPKIGAILEDNNLKYIPEAHCYLKIGKVYKDFTSINSDFNKIKDDILLERQIEPGQVAEFKIDYHKTYIKDWIKINKVPFKFNEIWQLREQCIINLSS